MNWMLVHPEKGTRKRKTHAVFFGSERTLREQRIFGFATGTHLAFLQKKHKLVEYVGSAHAAVFFSVFTEWFAFTLIRFALEMKPSHCVRLSSMITIAFVPIEISHK